MNYDTLWRQLTTLYDSGEAKAIVRYVLDARFGLSSTDIYCGKVTQFSPNERSELEEIMRRLRNAEPVQYVLGHADFLGRTLRVAPGALIPRPETEDLCEWITGSTAAAGGILDIGTGSGCIAIALALGIDGAKVTAWDISEEALRIARRNAEEQGADVDFRVTDALRPPADSERWDVIVSNPPYICHREKAAMERNVLDYEPHTALFVPDDDPLMFYRAITAYATEALKPGGWLYFEINPLFAHDMEELLGDAGLISAETRSDRFGRTRFARAARPAKQPQHTTIKK